MGLYRGRPGKPLNKSILDLSEGAESGAGPDLATLHQALACSIRDKPSMAWGRSELVQTFPMAVPISPRITAIESRMALPNVTGIGGSRPAPLGRHRTVDARGV